MGIINKIFSSVNGLYNNINFITLSGANDVIVVRRDDGTLKCSPFQLRFSKIKFYNSKSKTVHLYVNGELTDIHMTITSLGDLFFEKQRAIDDVNYDKVLGFIESSEASVNAILSNKIACVREEVSSGIRMHQRGSADDMGVNLKKMTIEKPPVFIKRHSQNPTTAKDDSGPAVQD